MVSDPRHRWIKVEDFAQRLRLKVGDFAQRK